MKNFNGIALTCFLGMLPVWLHAQSYITAVGARVDGSFGLTLQHAINDKATLEIIGNAPIFKPEFGLTGLYERHHKILVRNLNIYYGVGGHYYWKSAASKQEGITANNVFGLSFIGGAELSLGRLNVSIDYKPELHFSGDQVYPFEWHGAAVSVRYIIEKKPRRFLDFRNQRNQQKRNGGRWHRFNG